MHGGGSLELLERTAELAAIRHAAMARHGLLLVEGPAGIGKSALIAAAAAAGSQAGMDVFRARGAEIEAGFPFGVVRQLFEQRMATVEDQERNQILTGAAALAAPVIDPLSKPAELDPDGAQSAPAMVHGLYWVVSNFAARRPLLITVDDAHWADTPSLRFLAYLAPRLQDVPVVLVIAVRPGEPAAHEPPLRAIAAAATVIRPSPLSPEAVSESLEAALGSHVRHLAAVCAEATGGNPLYLRRLIHRLGEQGPTAEFREADVLTLGGADLAEDVLARVGRGGTAAARLAEAVATLGDRRPLGIVAQLAGLELRAASRAAAALVSLDILVDRERPAFVHPVIRAAVEQRVGPGAHRAAADLLAETGAPAEEIAAHAMREVPAAHGPTVARLRDAAREAMARGAPEAAVALLERAVAEPPPEAERPKVLLELGEAAAWLGHPQAAEHLEAAMAAAPDASGRARVALVLARLHTALMRLPDAVAVLRDALAEAEHLDEALATQLRLRMALSGMFDVRLVGETMPAVAALAQQPDDPAAAELLAAMQGVAIGLNGGSVHDVSAAFDAVDRAPASVVGWDLRTITAVNYVNIFREAEGEAMLEEARLAAQQTGHARAALTHLTGTTILAHNRGRLADVIEWGDRTNRLAHAMGAFHATAPIWGMIALAHLEKGDVVAAAAAVEQSPGPEENTQLMTVLLYHAMAALAAARGDHARSLAIIERADARFASLLPIPVIGPQMWSWRTPAVPALLRLKREEEAREFAFGELEQARIWDAPRPLGLALRMAALTVDGAHRVELLEESVAVLQTSTAELELAHSLVALGSAYRHDRRRVEARGPLAEGLDRATACGAYALVERARHELQLSGARPRRGRLTGPDALTAAETTVARLAAAGRTNREISEQLHITRKTVEGHLTNAYVKLGIAGREGLRSLLREDQDAARLGSSLR